MKLLPDEGQKISAAAKRKLILLGIFGWGLPLGAINVGLDYYQSPGLFPFNASGLYRILFRSGIWLIGGYFWGLWMSKYSDYFSHE